MKLGIEVRPDGVSSTVTAGDPAVIIHGNSLTDEEWSRRYIPAYILGLWSVNEQEVHLEDIFTRTKDTSAA